MEMMQKDTDINPSATNNKHSQGILNNNNRKEFERPNGKKRGTTTTTCSRPIIRRHNHNKNNDNNTDEIIRILEKRIVEEAPKRGYVPSLTQRVAFRALPISELTLMGLENNSTNSKEKYKKNKKKHPSGSAVSTTTTTPTPTPTAFTTMTAIQNACIPHALAGRDILGAAKTGSGKTLAFVIPVLELLYRYQYTSMDGPGAIILIPTRELAVQIFQVFTKIGMYHTKVTIGLLIGGKKDFYVEQQHIGCTNIIIATPGRLLQHLEQTSNLDISNVRIVVLDEADRILDMGFREQVLRIFEYLPSNNAMNANTNNYDDVDIDNDNDERQHQQQTSLAITTSSSSSRRQTLLFSATQTRDVSMLASLSLYRPEYIGVHDHDKMDTPETLQQSYVVVPLEHKLNAIYTFIKTHLKYKTIIFINTCCQVRYIYELFCTLRPGITIMALHGKLTQERRTQIYFEYIHKQHVVLLATDIVARGLDFPNIDWIVQMDVPEDHDMYIHRVGRTARYKAGGKSLLMITPQEENNGCIDTIVQTHTVPIKKYNINPNKATTITTRVSSAVASNIRLQELAKKAFYSYIRCIHFMPNQDIFKVSDIDYDLYSQSLGLSSTPKLNKIMTIALSKTREEYRQTKNVNKKLQRLKEQIQLEKLNKKKKKKEQEQLVDTNNDGGINKTTRKRNKSDDDTDDDNDDEDEILVPKQQQQQQQSNGSDKDNNNNHDDDHDDGKKGMSDDRNQVSTIKLRHPKKIRIDGTNGINTKILFDDDGHVVNEHDILHSIPTISTPAQDDLVIANDQYLQTIRTRLERTKETDNQLYKERVREKKLKKKQQQMGLEPEEEGFDTKVKQQQQHGATLLLPVESCDDHDDDDDPANVNDDDEHNNIDDGNDIDNDDDDDSSSNDNDDNDSDDDDDDNNNNYNDRDEEEDDDDDESDTIDVRVQEELALSLIRRG